MQKISKWRRMRLKNGKVWVAISESGRPLEDRGMLLVKYRTDQPHTYRVKQQNISDLPAKEEIPHADSISIEPAKSRSRHKVSAPSVQKEKNVSADHKENAIIVYTDGASSGNPGPAGIGVVISYKERRKEISRYIGTATNNIAELTAIYEALRAIKRSDIPVRLYTDSSYAHGVITLGWKAKKNTELVARIKKEVSRFSDLRIIKVRGHSGVPENERADFLATSAINKRPA